MKTEKSRKWVWITLVIVVVLVAAALLIWHFASGKNAETDETSMEISNETEASEKATTAAADTEAPKASAQNVTAYCGKELTPEDFLASCEDASEYTVKFQKAPDTDAEGKQDVAIIITDAFGNETVCEAELTLIKDVTAPEITGAEDITIDLGADFDPMEGISVRDDLDPDPKITSTTNVNTEKPGEYSVRYKAEDARGNRSFEVIKVNVAG